MMLRAMVSVVSSLTMMALGSCVKDQSPTITHESETLGAKARIHEVDMGSSGDFFVHGQLLLEGRRGKLLWANLECVRLQVGSRKSTKTYVDSVAHVLTQKYQANPSGVVDVAVYWTFSNERPILLEELHQAQLEILSGETPACFGFAQ